MTPKLIVITGPSGVGKGSLVKKLLEARPDYSLAVSATTRSKRPDEVHGRDYFFISEQEFKDLINKGDLLEWAEFAGSKYGTLKSQVDEHLSLGKRSILEIELAGARQIKKSSSAAAFIFIAPPSLEVLRERLVERGTESEDEISRRIQIAQIELAGQGEFDFILINDDLERSFQQLLNYCESL